MTESYAPFAAGAGADANAADWRRIFSALCRPGVLLGYSGELLVSPGGGNVAAVAAGRTFCAGTYYENDASLNLTVPANATAGIRYDRVVVRYDFVGETAAAMVLTGDNSNPPTLQADPTNLYDIPLAVIATPVGSGAFGSGDLIVALDRWATQLNSEVGTGRSWFGTATTIPKTYLAGFGQTLSRWALERLWAVSPTQGGFLPPYHGRRADGSNNLVMPDMRGRGFNGLDSMGGVSANRIDALDVVGNVFGDNTAVVPLHHHKFRDASNNALKFVWEVFGGTLGINPLAGGGIPVTASTMSAIFSTLGLPLDSDGDATTDDAGVDTSTVKDTRMGPTMLGYYLVRIA